MILARRLLGASQKGVYVPQSYTTDWKFPTASTVVATNENSWSNISNAYADDGSFMTASPNVWGTSKISDIVHFSGFDFADDVPVGATLAGFEVRFEFDPVPAVPGSALDYNFILAKSATLGDTAGNQKTRVGYPADTYTVGADDDMWSSTLTDLEVRATTFGVRFSVSKIDPEVTLNAGIDYLKVRITYDY